MPRPEMKEGYKTARTQTENGQTLTEDILDQNNNLIHRDERWYQEGQAPSPEFVGGHRQTFYTYDEEGRPKDVIGQTLDTQPGDAKHENQWHLAHQYDGGRDTVTGTIEHGQDKGHKWSKTEEVIKDFGDGRKIIKETTEILDQGQNKKRPAAGEKHEKLKYFEGDKFIGEVSTNLNTGETSKPWLAEGIEKLPDWA